MAEMDANMMIIPADCNGLIRSCRMIRAHSTATGSSTVIRIELIPAPIFDMPEIGRAHV